MFDSIDPRSPTPLYEQIGQCIRLAVAAGELAEGESLPSVRQLAGALRVNPATVSQAYRELAREGFVEMKHGAGTFVRALPEARKEEEQWLQARDLVRRLLADAARLGVSAQDLLTVLEKEVSETAPKGGAGQGGEDEREMVTLSEAGE